MQRHCCCCFLLPFDLILKDDNYRSNFKLTSITKRNTSDLGKVVCSVSTEKIETETETVTINLWINDFASRPETRGKNLQTSSIKAFVYDWTLLVYPKGNTNSPNDEEYVSCFVKCVMGDNDNAVTAKYTIRCKDKAIQFKSVFDSDNQSWGRPYHLKRTDVLKRYLDRDGSLLIEIVILSVDENEVVWYPQLNDMPNDLLIRLYRSSFAEGKDGED
jgi:hypothetical protein